jgi:hypothetical protein
MMDEPVICTIKYFSIVHGILLCHTFACFLLGIFFDTEDGGEIFLRKGRLAFNGLHGIVS